VARLSVRAAGGVVWRSGPGGVEILLVHRPRYDDWSLPKGKLDGGETDEECALREVKEETGLVTSLGPELPSTRYVDRKGRDKRVRYWAMTPVDGSFTPHDEVDEIRWVSLADAAIHLSYAHDADVLQALTAVLGPGADEGDR